MAALTSAAGRGLRLPMYVVDAFTSRPFAGNPAAVCLLAPGVSLSDELRQKIAAEMNHSETAFIEPLEASASSSTGGAAASDVFATGREFRLRWFTPTTEVPLCGHATLASAAVLIQACGNTQPSVHFHTKSGELVVSRAAGSSAPPTADAQQQQQQQPPVVLSMSLPCYDPVDALPSPARDPAGPLVVACTSLALAGLSGQPPQQHQLPVKEVRYAAKGGLNYLLVVLGEGVSRQQLEAVAPDFESMRRGAGAESGVHGVIVCARGGAGDEHEVHSRFFGPWLGVNEDPVTGSAHAVLGPYWQPLLRPAGGGGATGPMRMRQCSARGGDVEVEVFKAEGGEERVRVSGSAALVLEGTLRL
ncbi:hypothetical protein HYH02_012929 [Chlamydomonas schloesseri]|uniref:Uncharacterized protein n=1 Tax=Chlamydomonas schloesseri TaxID=2026947 RepID=A0A835VY96_9CHLO|nr:hypothetical protein HYH02_012929 [Chlamydomonas schloesseri]|eukprot:KAG2432355.1 hypothetical protein HYH02_012929 [Chlamydomonas schloesseri]